VRPYGISIRRRLAVVLAMLVTAALALPDATPASAATKPSLRLVVRHGHSVAVAGAGWKARAMVVVTISTGPWVEGLTLRTTAKGTFVAAADPVSFCNRLTWTARDKAGHTVKVKGPALGCASQLDVKKPAVTLLSGSRVAPGQRQTIEGGPRADTVSMHVGDTLYVWQPGKAHPDFTANAEPTYLALLRQGTTAARDCAQVDCAPGFYWEWVALRSGDTVIDLSPACRLTTPPCGRPDYAVRVHIDP
jgi:hypothetical protein